MRRSRAVLVLAVAAAVSVGLAPAAAQAQAAPPAATQASAPDVAVDAAPLPPGASAASARAELSADAQAAASCTPVTRTYVSRPDFGEVPGACTTGPDAGRSTDKTFADSAAGATIFDSRGELVWFGKGTTDLTYDLRKFTYRGQPVLAYFQGKGSAVLGSGVGSYTILDTSYRPVASVQMGGGFTADFHEFEITPRGTALMGSYPLTTIDASAAGGSATQQVVDYVVQEVDIATGEVLFQWRASEHVPASDSYFPRFPGAVWDYFHGNSIDLASDGTLLVSGRHTHAAYKIARDGTTVWTFGGKSSSFTPLAAGIGVSQAEAYGFCWQHDFRQVDGNNYSVFDNGSAIGFPGLSCGPARGLQMTLVPGANGQKGLAFVTRAYHHDPDLNSEFAGNFQLLPDGDRQLGFGSLPIITRVDGGGALQLETTLTTNTYRGYSYPWSATPAEPPRSVVQGGAVYASWNGATEVASWQVLAGSSSSTVVPVGGRQPRTGFETRLALPAGTDTTVVRVQPYNAAGEPLSPAGDSLSGTTTLVGLGATAPVGPGFLDLSGATTGSDGTLTLAGSSVSLPPVTADFLVFGFAPAQATLAFQPAAGVPVTGRFGPGGSTLSFQTSLRAADFSIGGFSLSGLLGPTCTTSTPVTVTLTAAGDAREGSPLRGSYTIPPFTGCAGTDGGVTAVMSRPGNTLDLTLTLQD